MPGQDCYRPSPLTEAEPAENLISLSKNIAYSWIMFGAYMRRCDCHYFIRCRGQALSDPSRLTHST